MLSTMMNDKRLGETYHEQKVLDTIHGDADSNGLGEHMGDKTKRAVHDTKEGDTDKDDFRVQLSRGHVRTTNVGID